MCICDIVTKIIIPLLAAGISGGMTLWGVNTTIKHEKRMRQDELRERYKPFFYCLQYNDDHDAENVKVVSTKYDKNNSGFEYRGLFRNTEKANFLIESISVDGNMIQLDFNNHIKKDEYFELVVITELGTDAENIVVNIRDDLGNALTYRLPFNSQRIFSNVIEM